MEGDKRERNGEIAESGKKKRSECETVIKRKTKKVHGMRERNTKMETNRERERKKECLS